MIDHASVHEVLGPTAGSLRGRTLVNLTTSTPNQARELAAWSASHGIDYLDGGIMAVPEMIGGPGSAILYSGSQTAFDAHRALLDLWGESTYFGSDAGMASLHDLAMLAGMYAMFAGFLHGAAMVGSEAVTVWNRTPSRADELVTAGATLARTPADALVASELIILSLTDYPAMYDILGGSTGALAGKVLVDLSSDNIISTIYPCMEGAAFTPQPAGASMFRYGVQGQTVRALNAYRRFFGRKDLRRSLSSERLASRCAR
ncbi:NAD(P)-binding domain-containing protein [Sorangium sp. So ce281]|uniref:NAD(P)-binding domain-containing protein n=1 Tax=Sorangium sp. So ce281 TaxID=3133293 RepID=UPI003F631FD0